ncbi:MAG: hypothetical protein ACI9MC_002738 [Kiritimatiellia bacterium]|jgi:hypothetical protein
MFDPESHIPSDLIRSAQASLDQMPSAPVSPDLVHKHQEQNVAISRVAAWPNRPHTFVCQLRVLVDHPFFFEHPTDHVPGLLLIEGARQFGVAVAHLHYSVPNSTIFVLETVQTHFTRFAELDSPTAILGVVHDRRTGGGRLRGMSFSGSFVQSGVAVGTMTGIWKMIDEDLMRRLRARASRGGVN